jgi:simple sugar transport system permease protein
MTEKLPALDLTNPIDPPRYRQVGLMTFIGKNRRPFSALLVFAVLILGFMIANPQVFLNPLAYRAVFISLPVSIILATSLVFLVTAGEIDLSFGSIMGLATLGFATAVAAGWSPFLGLLAALVIGVLAGILNGLLVTKIGLSSLVVTLGMNFLWRGFINIITQGEGIPLTQLRGGTFFNLLVGDIGLVPVQMIWGVLFAVIATLVFNYHKFGSHICCIGDNPESSREMGIHVNRTKIYAFALVGLASGFAGVMSTLINTTFWPTTGDGYLLPVLAAVFVGGTPTWGGVGTVPGAAIGAFIVGFIETGVIAAGLTGYYTRFFYGLIIILSLIGHKLNQPRYR